MKVPFRVSGAHEAFMVDHEMMKGFESMVVDHFTFGVRSYRNKVNKVMNRRVRSRGVKINDMWRFRNVRQNAVLGFT